MKLYRVELQTAVFVVADNEDAAGEIAKEHVSDEAEFFEVFCNEIERIDSVDPDWRDSIPYGGDANTTISQILSQGDQE